MKRVVTPELLDEDLGTPQEILETLLDLRSINQKLGGFTGMAWLLRSIAQRTGKRSLTFLDVAGGTGDVAEYVSRNLKEDGISIRATVLDRAVSHMSSWRSPGARVAGDALALPFCVGSFDVVGCNLFCHHLEPDEMAEFFIEALRVSTVAVIASDLRRNLFHLMAATAGRLGYRSRLTRSDAPASVRRAYTMSEIREIATKSGSAKCEIRRQYFQRFGLILWKAAA